MGTFRVQAGDALKSTGRLIEGLRNPRHFMQIIAEELYRVARVSFEKETSPDGGKWVPLSIQYAIRKAKLGKGNQGILRFRGRLFRSLRRGVDSRVAWATAGPLSYAAIHQYGGKSGRKRRATIPARPYMGFPPDSQERCARDIEQAAQQVFNGKRRG